MDVYANHTLFHDYLTGVKRLQDHVFNNIYKKALQDENCTVRLQVFRMVLCGVPRSGKTTFWKRLALKGFKPSEVSPSTGATESHYLSAIAEKKLESDQEPHVHTEILFDLHLYCEDVDLDHEALTIYKHILEAHKPQTFINTDQVKATNSVQSAGESDTDQNSQSADNQENHSSQSKTHTASFDVNQQPTNQSKVLSSDLVVSKKLPSDPIVMEIDKCFEELNDLLQKGEKLPNIPNIKKMCHLQDIGGQRAFLQLLPTVSVGKALYLLFFNYKDFGRSVCETVQMEGSCKEVHTDVEYEQIDVIMQSLICVSTSPTKSSDNIALLVGTHVDEVQPEDISHVNDIIYEKVEPFLKRSLMYAERDDKKTLKERLVLKVAINKNKLCNHEPEYCKQVIMHIVDKKLSCPESEELPASWYMFSVILRRIQCAGYSILRYDHCQQIADRLHIQEYMLQSLLSRLHKVLGIVVYFPNVKELEDIVICDPAFIYRRISELIFNSFDDCTSAQLSNKLKKWGMFKCEELEKHCEIKKDQSYLEMSKLITLLEHLGIIAPVENMPTAEPEHKDGRAEHSEGHDYLIPCVLKDAKDLKIQIQDTQACSIAPLRIYFECGFAPMGGFCYLFTKLISDKGWKLCLPEELKDENNIYWRNKVTFREVEDIYCVTLLSTEKYYEIHIVHSQSEQPFQLETDGRTICKQVWDAIRTILENSLNKTLHNYKTACICTINHQKTDQHVMKFNCKPHECVPRVKAHCSRNRNLVTVSEEQRSVMVWYKVCITM